MRALRGEKTQSWRCLRLHASNSNSTGLHNADTPGVVPKISYGLFLLNEREARMSIEQELILAGDC